MGLVMTGGPIENLIIIARMGLVMTGGPIENLRIIARMGLVMTGGPNRKPYNHSQDGSSHDRGTQ